MKNIGAAERYLWVNGIAIVIVFISTLVSKIADWSIDIGWFIVDIAIELGDADGWGGRSNDLQQFENELYFTSSPLLSIWSIVFAFGWPLFFVVLWIRRHCV